MTPEPPIESGSVTTSEREAECRSPLGVFEHCPQCGGGMAPEHAHYRCTGCGWRDSCCD